MASEVQFALEANAIGTRQITPRTIIMSVETEIDPRKEAFGWKQR